MDKNTKKVLDFIIKSDGISFLDLANQNLVSIDILVEIVYNLKTLDLIKFTNDEKIRSTNKGNTYKNVSWSIWLAEHFIETLALIVAIIALIRTF